MQTRSLPKISLSIIFLLVITTGNCLLPALALPSSIKKPIIRGMGLVPSPILAWPENSFDHVILVDKSEQKVLVYSKNNPYEPSKIYRCSTGENDGPKWEKNDRKTPEGIYFFIGSFSERELAPIYGVKAFPIDYPNFMDRREGKSGYGIWFHGTNKPLKPRDSNGCIALENEDINDLARYIKVHNTPVILSEKIQFVDPSKLSREASEFKELIENWRGSWEKEDIDRYISYYHREFFSGGKNIQQWKAYKERLAKQYKKLRVKVEDVQLFKHDSLAMARFIQKYDSGLFKSNGIKTLYFKENSGKWRIIGEDFERISERTVLAKKETVPSNKDILDFINSWRNAWEKKNLTEYIRCYDKSFEARGMKLSAWKKHRQALNKKYKTLRIKITDIKILDKSDKQVTAVFVQDYRADGYNDRGIKELLIINEKGHWKIRQEEWKPMGG